MAAESFPEARVALEEHQELLRSLPNVVGWGIGRRERRGKPTTEVAAQVFVTHKVPLEELPADGVCPPRFEVAGSRPVPTDVIAVGVPQLLQDTGRYRPVRGGVSMGTVVRCNAGTLGGFFCDDTNDEPVWVSNNHVVTATANRTAIPGDARVLQPGCLDGGVAPADVIGSTVRITPIATNPNSALAPINALDASIGSIDVDYQVDVVDIGPAPFELGAAALDMAVQKRGRTTLLTTNGTVTSTNVSVLINYGTTTSPAFGIIGTGGSVFRIAAPAGQRFLDRGDSGSLVFATTTGEIEGTFPCVGLAFGGGGTPFGNTGFACDISTVTATMRLVTVCTCVVRAILTSVLGADATASADAIGFQRRRSEHLLRRLRDRVLAQSATGKVIADTITALAPELTNVLIDDDEAYGLAVRTVAPWVRASTTLEVLDRPVDPDTIRNGLALAGRVGQLRPELAPRLDALAELLKASEGTPVRQLVGWRRPRPRRRTKK